MKRKLISILVMTLILLNSSLAYAKIQKDVVIVGVSTRAEIWNSENWDKYTNSDSLDVSKIASQMSNLGI